MPSTTSQGDNYPLAMSVDNISFLLDRLGQDCDPLQYLRELTQNSIEAILRTKKPGQIIWDVDWTHYEQTGVYKLSVTDTGDGMTGEEMKEFINKLSSSLSEQSFGGNYGVGAKISAVTQNHAGVMYWSWKNGEGAAINLYRDSDTNEYGLQQWDLGDGEYEHYLPINAEGKPEQIDIHGTKVVLMGNDLQDNTMQPPKNAPTEKKWIAKYLNTRYFKFPEAITIKAREGWEFPRVREDKDRNFLRTLHGQKWYLDKYAKTSGSVELSNATAYWWIMKEDGSTDANQRYSEVKGHAAALYQNELYEMTPLRAGGVSRLQQFGVIFGYKHVVIYIEPHSKKGVQIDTNTARTILLFNNKALPWDSWAEEFRNNLPDEIAKLVEEKASGSSSGDYAKSIRDRLGNILHMFKVSRYKPITAGSLFVDGDQLILGSTSTAKTGDSTTSDSDSEKNHPPQGEALGNVYSLFIKTDGVPGKKIQPDPFPKVQWVSVEDGTREPGDIEDRAAKYLPAQNLIHINKDFRVFTDLIKYFMNEFGDAPGTLKTVTEAVMSWYEQTLMESVMGINTLKGGLHWTSKHLESALTEEALTVAVMPRYHTITAINRQLRSKFRPGKADVASNG